MRMAHANSINVWGKLPDAKSDESMPIDHSLKKLWLRNRLYHESHFKQRLLPMAQNGGEPVICHGL
ncbi:hypothetical protein N1E17_01845 [Lacticaseibacillus paracasei]